MTLVLGVGRLTFSADPGSKSAELLFVAPDACSDGFQGGVEVSYFLEEAGEGAVGGGAAAVFLDDSAEAGAAVEGGAA
ncbi:hypothetical protein [Nonomuraea helvata]|uniref:Uncharacterized protein n=1 Tax=Nonomuraea helvata TaxID=37484 RepID=A0ABV5S571_9ACTN